MRTNSGASARIYLVTFGVAFTLTRTKNFFLYRERVGNNVRIGTGEGKEELNSESDPDMKTRTRVAQQTSRKGLH